MLRPRIIPCLLVHKGGLVKTVGFDKPKYVGDPLNAVRIFNEKGADEVVLLDINASSTRSGPPFELLEEMVQRYDAWLKVLCQTSFPHVELARAGSAASLARTDAA